MKGGRVIAPTAVGAKRKNIETGAKIGMIDVAYISTRI